MPVEPYPLLGGCRALLAQVRPLGSGVVQMDVGHAERIAAAQHGGDVVRVPDVVHDQRQVLLPPGKHLIYPLFPFFRYFASHEWLSNRNPMDSASFQDDSA